ncbi:MAG: hypothetical protein A2147_00615 [Chloroflexi bacterium RBG_16_57_8]|nr:MAG: hypothetical protein A2147_00615 [Chloroflexi bacterium RBG_16_57_8]
MIGVLLQLVKPGPATPELAESAEQTVGIPPSMIGFVVLALILVPVVVLISSAIFGAPRNSRVPALFLAAVVILISVTIIGFAAFGSLLGLVFPG